LQHLLDVGLEALQGVFRQGAAEVLGQLLAASRGIFEESGVIGAVLSAEVFFAQQLQAGPSEELAVGGGGEHMGHARGPRAIALRIEHRVDVRAEAPPGA